MQYYVNYKTDGICRQEGRPTNTGSQNTPTQHRLSSVTDGLKAEVQRETKIKESIAGKTKERWHGKRMYGQLPRNLEEKLEDNEESYRWLKSEDIKGETESTIVAAQDQTISTNILRIKC